MKDIGIDLGTTNTLVYIKGQGIVLDEPSIVAIDKDNKTPIAYGIDANLMYGKTPSNINTIKPIRDGVIADFDVTVKMLEYFISKAKVISLFKKPRIIICYPSNITSVEKNALKEVGLKLGARKVYLEDEPVAALMGVGVDINMPNGNMIIDIGGGTTDIAIISLGKIVISESINIAGNLFDNKIKEYIKEKYKVNIGEKTANYIKHEIGFAYKSDESKISVNGINLENGLPTTIKVYAKDIEDAIHDDILKIIENCKKIMELAPPEIISDIVENGIYLTGGGSLLRGIASLFENKLGVKIHLSESPLINVIEGVGVILEND